MEMALTILLSLSIGATIGFLFCSMFIGGRAADENKPGQEG